MNRPSLYVVNFGIFLGLVLIAAALQSTIFYLVLGKMATVQIVLAIITYISLFRNPSEGLLFVFAACFATGLLSTIPVSLNVFSGFAVFFALRAWRNFVYSSSAVYFNWTVLGTVFGFHLVTWITSELLEPRAPAAVPVNWILEVLVTALFTRVLYLFFLWIDKKTGRIAVSELM